MIKRFGRDSFDVNDPDFPSSLCGGCSMSLYQKDKDNSKIIKVATFIPDRTTKLRSKICDCLICEVAKAKMSMARKMKKKSGRPKNPTPFPISPASSRPPVTSPPSTITICRVCCAEIYKGCRHICLSSRSSRKRKVDNLVNLISSPETTKKLADKIAPKVERKNLFGITAEQASTIGKNMNLSVRKNREFATNLRKATGSRKAVGPGLEVQLTKDRHKLDDFFKYEMSMFIEEESKKKKRPMRRFLQHAVFAKDVTILIDKIYEHRQINPNDALIRVGLDGGGGFLKICLSVFNIKDPISCSSSLDKKFLDSGVKKVQLVAVTPDVPENYVNMKRLWIEAGIDRLPYKFTIATDLKLCNILLGLQNHSCMHPCCWCDIDKYRLNEKGNQRTFDSLINLFYDYRDANANKGDASKYGNVIHLPLYQSIDGDTPVIQKVPPPELHLLLGPTNKIYSELENVWPALEAWLQSIHVKKNEYHGGQFEGNDCKKILRLMDSLEERCPDEFLPFVAAFRSFNDVRLSCYGSKLAPDYKVKIAKFKADYMKLGISVTPKIHAVFYHIEEFCDYSGMALGPFSEQTTEALHHEFEECWDNFAVKDFDHPKYPDRFLSAVKVFNSLHL